MVRGDTLWGLSQDIAARQGVSINQVMLAVQQSNPQAFLDDNINRLMAGEVLRIPEREDMLRISARDAMLEVQRQESLYRTRWDIPGNPDDIPTISDLAQEATAEGVGPDSSRADAAASDDKSLVLVPPSERDDAMAEGMGQGTGGSSEASEGVSVVEELARTQEELANARQENTYLAERISELESALEERAADDGPGVADNNLADMEDRLREDRLSGEPEPELEFVDAQPAPWMSRFGLWLAAAFVLLIAAVVLFLRSRRNREFIDGGAVPDPNGGTATVSSMAGMTAAPEPDTEAVEMDLADPEARLDLARAYAAMGRSNKARELLESVVQDGNPVQEREAREMLREL